MSTAIVKHDAPQLIRYEAAKTALAECVRIDDAAEWADKAAAMKMYARQRDDKSLENMAMRIRARAVRRCGELLNEIPPHEGGRKPVGASPHVSRSQAAADAGLSRDQKAQALRVANVPAGEFEEAIESESPASVEELEERGTKKQPKPLVDLQGVDPKDFNRSMHLSAAMERLADLLRGTEASTFARGVLPSERERVGAITKTLHDFFNELARLPKEKHK